MIESDTDAREVKRGPDGRFLPGTRSGNPAGRARGTRNRINKRFLRVLARDFAEHGAEAIERYREARPARYCRLIATILLAEENTLAKSESAVNTPTWQKDGAGYLGQHGGYPSADREFRVGSGREIGCVRFRCGFVCSTPKSGRSSRHR